MPLIQVKTSAAADASTTTALLQQLSRSLAKHTGKPETYVMTCLDPEVAMTFGGTAEPVCYIEVKNIGNFRPEQTQAMSQDFSQLVSQSLGVPINRIYLEFSDAKGYLWGWNGSTFG